MLSLLLVTGILCTKQSNHRVEEMLFENKLSYMPPHVGENGRNDFYELNGQYLAITGTKDDRTQLGYLAAETKGFLQTKEPIKMKNFYIEVEYEYNPLQGADGIGFWLSSKLADGVYYGRDIGYSGFGIIIDGTSKPYAKFVDSKNLYKSKSYYPRFTEKSKISFKVQNDKLTAKLNTNNFDYILYDGPIELDANCHFGISASTGSTNNSILRIRKVVGYNLKKVKVQYVKGETKKSRKLIFLFGLACIGGLGYYLYSKQAKSFELKN